MIGKGAWKGSAKRSSVQEGGRSTIAKMGTRVSRHGAYKAHVGSTGCPRGEHRVVTKDRE